MDEDIYVYLISFPRGTTHEAVLPCADGYTVYIDDRLGREGQLEAYKHALKHINRTDFEKSDVNEIELEAHE